MYYSFNKIQYFDSIVCLNVFLSTLMFCPRLLFVLHIGIFGGINEIGEGEQMSTFKYFA